MTRPVPALSDLSVTEFLTLSRLGFLPHGLVVGASVYEAASEVGYASEAAFSRAFKKVVGISPAAWRERQSDDGGSVGPAGR